jgi:hypothetical protein
MKIISSVLVILFMQSAWTFELPSCLPSKDSCEFYQCLEAQYPCGPNGYVLQFGSPQCEKYLHVQALSTLGLQLWYPRVRECLQEELAQGQFATCQELSDFAFQSHIPCYVKTGFCQLSFVDRLQYMMVVGSSLLDPSVQMAAWQIQQICR